MAEYRRKILYELLIGKPLLLNKNTFIPLKNEDERAIALEEYYNKNDANAYIFSEHNIVFKIKMANSKEEANKADIKIYNVDDEILEYLITNQDNKLVVTLDVGDNAQGLKELFNGTIEKVEVNEGDETRIVTLTVLDGITSIKNAKSVRRWPRGTPYQTVIRDLANDMKVPINRMALIEGKTDSPVTLMGPTFRLMQNQMEKLGFDYSIDKGVANILPKNKRFTKQVSYITKDTGLIGKISDYSNASNNTANSTSTNTKGISFTCLIDGNLAPNETVYVKDGKYDGAYKITDISFSGNYEGDDWTCDIIAVETDGEIVDV